MEIAPKLVTARLPQADPGDLFIVRDDTGSYVALAVKEPHDGDQFVLILGPPSSKVPEVPILTNFPSGSSVVSFGKEYTLRLPCEAKAWLPTEPQTGHCLVLSTDKVYMRAMYRPFNQAVNVYVDVDDGQLVVNSSGHFAHPREHCTYTVEWDLLTVEKDPRLILAFRASKI
jgi:hypothetical protein